MNSVVLDASALLSLINNEKGANMVAEHLSGSVMSSVNVSEVIAVMTLAGFQNAEITNILGDLVHKVEDFDYEQAIMAGFLRKKTKALGLSFGDRACIVLAEKLKLPVMTADKTWTKLPLQTDLILIR